MNDALPNAIRDAYRQAGQTFLTQIHELMDGEEWSPDTLDEIAHVLSKAGLEIHEPGYYDEPDEPDPERWIFGASVYVEFGNEEVTGVTLVPHMGAEFIPDFVFDEEGARSQHEVNTKLATYLDKVRIQPALNGAGKDLYCLEWEG